MVKVLMVAEKPALARSLAGILSDGKASQRTTHGASLPLLEYSGTFRGQAAHFKFTSVRGHMMEVQFPSKYNNWDKVNPFDLFAAPIELQEAESSKGVGYALRSEAKGCDYLVLWLDCDPEGENICFEVIDAVSSVLNQRGGQQIFRAKFSAITPTDIKRALQTLEEPDKNVSLSVDARRELDLRMGVAFTRYQSKFFQGKYGDLDSQVLSFGPCQTPTLGLCVQRHDTIQTFQPEPYWTLDVQIAVRHSAVKLNWSRVRLFDRTVATLFEQQIKMAKSAMVEFVQSKEKVKSRPCALNTVEMLRMCSSGLGIGPQQAMVVAERLYIQGYISYPRTETTMYPRNFDVKSVLKELQGSSQWHTEVQNLLQGELMSPKGGKDKGDHPPITPMRLAKEVDLSGDMWRVYELVTRHFIATFSPDCRYLVTTAHLDICGEKFTLSGQQLVSPGFTAVLTWMSPETNTVVPKMQKGEEYIIKNVTLTAKQTSPPGYLTESDLISLMEQHGIGTDASIPKHINTICERNYVTVQAGRTLVPTNLGVVMIHGYLHIDHDLCSPTMRAAVEEQFRLIAQGKRKFAYFEKSIRLMDELFEVNFTPLAKSGKNLSRCGKCNRYLKYISAKPQRLYCQTCDETYSLPHNGKIVLYKELRCPLDGFELVMCSTGSNGKSYPLCPYCYNSPPFENMAKGSGCNACINSLCPHSAINLGVSPCVNCETGILVLDPVSKPKWRLACNSCNAILSLIQDAHDIRVTKELCECGASCIAVDFHKDKSPLNKGETKYNGCIFCDDLLSSMVTFKLGATTHPMHRRGRGRKKGGRGRGRSRAQRQPKDKMARLDQYFV
eukprot:gene1141-4360_t